MRLTRTLPLLVAALATGACVTTRVGTITPTREICRLGAFDQEIRFADDFKIERIGDEGLVSNAELHRELTKQFDSLGRYAHCPGEKPLGTLRYELKRLESGSNRAAGMKIMSWSLLLLLTLGGSSAYPITEERWLTMDVDATLVIGDEVVWKGQVSGHAKVKMIQKELEPLGVYITEVLKRVQERAVGELSPIAGGRAQ
jgi:hypothetical protein